MNKKKAAKRVYKVTLDSFKESLNADKYGTATGARKAASYLSDTDKAAALKLVAKHFGIGVDEPGPTGRKGAKKVGKKKVAKAVVEGKFRADVAEAPKRKPGRPRKNPLPEAPVEAAPVVAAPVEAPKQRKRRAAKVEATEPVRTPEPKSQDAVKFEQISSKVDLLSRAVDVLRKVNDLFLNAGGSASQDVADAAADIAKALKPSVSALAHQDAPPPPVPTNGVAERPFDPELLEAAAQSVGIPLPGDTTFQ